MVLFVLTLLAALGLAPSSAACAVMDDERQLIQALDRWRKAFTAGRIRLEQRLIEDERAGSIYRKAPLPAGLERDLTHETALGALLERAIEQGTIGTTQSVVQLASLGYDPSMSFKQPPFRVRNLCLDALRRIEDPGILVFLAGTARGDTKGWRTGWQLGYQITAIRSLGNPDLRAFRPLIEQQLRSEHREVRLASVEAIRDAGWAKSLAAINEAICTETDPSVVRMQALAMHSILRRQHISLEPRDVRDAILAATEPLGKTSWRADLALVDLLHEYRSALSIEPLIAILERFAEERDSGRPTASPLLLHKAHEALRSLTGADFLADQPEKWRAFWEKEKDGFQLAPRPEYRPDANRTYASKFFGIPVQGSRVVFVIDLSGSMAMHDVNGPEGLISRADAAKRELLGAIERMPPDATFNVVFFSTKAKEWRPQFQSANERNKTTLATRLAKLPADGATNLFGALQIALGIKSLAYGQRYESQADEIFLLSDGEPSAGSIVDPGRILEVISEGNRYNGVRIHAVSMGYGLHTQFMRLLAKQNDGQFVRL